MSMYHFLMCSVNVTSQLNFSSDPLFHNRARRVPLIKLGYHFFRSFHLLLSIQLIKHSCFFNQTLDDQCWPLKQPVTNSKYVCRPYPVRVFPFVEKLKCLVRSVFLLLQLQNGWHGHYQVTQCTTHAHCGFSPQSNMIISTLQFMHLKTQ